MTGRAWVKRVVALVAIAVAAGGLMIAGATSASAHPRYAVAKAGQIPVGEGYLDAGHHWIKTCDVRADDRGVRTHYKTSLGKTGHVGDPDGHEGGICGQRAVGTTSDPVIWINVCAGEDGKDEFCSGQVAA